jgi:D-arabinono-1,4-lactone oxidase
MAETVPPLTQVEQLSALLQKVALTAESANQKVNWESILKLLGTDEHSPGDVLNGVGEDTLKELLEFLDIWISGQNTMIPTKWEADYTDLVYCSTVEEVQAKVKECLSNGSILRIAGAQHSTPEAVFAPEGEKAIRVKLEGDLRAIEWLDKDPVNDTITLRVGAGCNLGIDPSDPNSNASNSLTRQLDARGYALPILGGMSHQTIGGYIAPALREDPSTLAAPTRFWPLSLLMDRDKCASWTRLLTRMSSTLLPYRWAFSECSLTSLSPWGKSTL